MRFHSLLRPFLCASALIAAGIPSALAANQIRVSGSVYVNQGLVGVGRLPSNLKDKFNETFGSFSAMTMQPGTWLRQSDGRYVGTLLTQPDRGYNVTGTTNYAVRYNKVSFSFAPADQGAATQDQLQLTLADSILFTEADGTPLTAMDPSATSNGASRSGFPVLPVAFNGRLSLDPEGIVVAPDGNLWISDEYGPYIYKFSPAGTLLAAIRPPEALIPKRSGADNFSSDNAADGQPKPSPTNPVTGRQNNQGFEGLTLSPDGKTLFVLLQSATRQDGGTGGSSPRQFTRFFAYDLTKEIPTVKAEYVLELPTYKQGSATRVPAQSEMLAISDTQFLVLARDGNGHGTATPTSLYRAVLVYEIGGATNIAGTQYDSTATAVAPAGKLAAGIVPMKGSVLIDMNDAAELAKFGLNNGPVDSMNTLSEKWEALTLVPAMDSSRPDDWFLFVGNDNDFLTRTGFQDGMAYDAGLENDSVILAYRLTLPARLLNVSSRAMTLTGEGTHIAGFVVGGTRPKTLLIRGVGPALASMGVNQPLSNPRLKLYDSAGHLIAWNDDWNSTLTADFNAVGAFSLNSGSKDAALKIDLSPGAYSAHVEAVEGSGVSLIEVYEMP